ncbi:hypothetical protein ADK86_20160 [Streptomyces sp. NRRL F-5755]|uniref:hypothetical protein n=1 Tax=Streptomyces sp. NRRL F-5755 TaxID=1519475 RepID=UPI0006AD8581|nr:hypothetical protein [Streptomyces sp. NRRL F-5755]KOT92672.1 hypothetical protein ADK86_20160 [Streptomyces sp. NRRL F-5755]
MATSRRTSNTKLTCLLREAAWSGQQFANAVNRAGAEAGLTLRYEQSAVAHWLSGTMPRPQVRPVVLEALARRLGRPVTHAEAGFPAPPGGARPGDGSAVEELLDLSRDDMDPSRRGVLQAGLYSAALAVPLFADLAGRAEAAVRPGRTGRVGPAQVETVRAVTDRVADILDEFGGGHARPMAAAFLVNSVGPWLTAPATERVHRDLLAAAADLTYLTGWMAMYERAHGLGQRYYVKALHLAGEAHDHLTYCRTLRGMSLQASSLGYGAKALDLADSAAAAAPSAGPRLVAFLRGQQAHAASMTGNRHTAITRLREAESALSKADSRRESIGGYDQSAYLFHVSHVLHEFKDLPGSVKAMHSSLKAQPSQERQGRAHSHALLAQRQFELGHLDAACATWHRFLDDYTEISSARGDAHFATLRSRIRPHLRARAVRDLNERVRNVAATKS